MSAPSAARTAADGSLHPQRGSPTFEQDVRRMFATIADGYDLFNHLATFGQDLLWRPRAVWAVARLVRGPVERILDVGCGTGGLARQLSASFPSARVVATDFTSAMVHRAAASRVSARLGFAVAGIGTLPFRPGSFDVVASAFVARNLADLPSALRDLRRVLRPEGTLLTLEVGEPDAPAVRRLFHAHFDHAVPLLGRAFAREGPYSYLPESLRVFPSRARFVELLADAGFPRTRVVPMSLGIVTAFLSEASSRADARA